MMKNKICRTAFAVLLVSLSCQKKQMRLQNVQKATIDLQNYISPLRVGLADVSTPLRIAIKALDDRLDLPDGEIYTFSVYLNGKLQYEKEIEKDFELDMVGNNLIIPINWAIYADQMYSLQFSIHQKLNAQNVLMYQGTVFIEVEKYTLRTQEDLAGIANFDLAGNYKLGNNIVLNKPFKPIALCQFVLNISDFSIQSGHVILQQGYQNCTPFSGQLNGKGYTISNLQITDYTAYSGVGLFGVIDGKNAGVENLTLEIGVVSGNNLVGALAGFVRSDRKFKNIKIKSVHQAYHQENVKGSGSYFGGAIGFFAPYTANYNAILLENIHSNVNVSGGALVGGLVGASLVSMSALRYANTSHHRIFGTRKHIGGLVGFLDNASLRFSDSGADIGADPSASGIGGLVGTMRGKDARISDAYHYHLVQAQQGDFNLGQLNTYRKIEGGNYVAGLVGQIASDVPAGALQYVYVDSYNIEVLQSAGVRNIFCQNEEQFSYVQNAFYSMRFIPKTFAGLVRQIDKNTANLQHFTALGFDMFGLWTWQANTLGSYPTLNFYW